MNKSASQQTNVNDIPAIILTYGSSEVQIAPDFGCNILSVVLNGQKIIEGQTQKKQLEEDYLCKSEILLPYPNRVSKGTYSFEGRKYTLPINEVARGHALHGCFMKKKYTLKKIEQRENEIAALFKTVLEADEYEGYPFRLESYITIALSEKNLTIMTKSTNMGSDNLPYGVGWHPYFTAGKKIDDCTLRIPAKSIMENSTEEGEDLIPTGKMAVNDFGTEPRKVETTQFDTCFADVIDQKVQFENIEMWMDDSMKYIQIYTPVDRQSIAIEPMSCAPNAFNNGLGLIVLKPQESATHQFGVRVTD